MSFTSLILNGPPQPNEEKPGTIARLGLSDHAVDSRYLIYDKTKGAGNKAPVEDSEDLQRILALPRRPRPTKDQQEGYAKEMTQRLRVERTTPCDCAKLNPSAVAAGVNPCITELKPVQGWYLYEAAQVGGCLGFIIVGGGKTGIDALLAMVLENCRTYVLMLPNALVDQFNRDFQLWSQHFKTPNLAGSNGPFDPKRPTLRVLKYSELSRKNFATWLKAMKPDAFGCDEAQSLKDPYSVRTDRFLRYFEESEDGEDGRIVRAFFHSGSLTTRAIEDYSHLSALALREGSPVPLQPATVTKWGLAINPAIGRSPAPKGALRYLCEPGETLRAGFQRRLVETLGVITTEDAELDVALNIIRRDPGPLPEMVAAMLRLTRERDMRPDGERFEEKVETVRCLRELASGFFYRWRYPHVYDAEGKEVESDEDREKVIDLWFSRRSAWAHEIRQMMERRSDLMDSPALLEEAAERFYEDAEELDTLPTWESETYLPWKEIENRVEYEKDTVWIDKFLVYDAARWMHEGPGVCWYKYEAFGDALGELTGLPHYAGKNDVRNLNPTPAMVKARADLIQLGQWKETAASWLGIEDGSRPILCSIQAFNHGVNLQYAFRRMQVCQSPSDGGIWEQMMGRLHRTGQPAERVDVYVYRHTEEVANALDDAREYAKYTFETIGKPEKLLYATWSI